MYSGSTQAVEQWNTERLKLQCDRLSTGTRTEENLELEAKYQVPERYVNMRGYEADGL